MNSDQLRDRTKAFAVRIVKLVGSLPSGSAADVMGRQLLRSGTSVGANYREALRASSRKHFISIIQIALREADETLYWLELLIAAELLPESRLESLLDEANQLVAILAATSRTAKDNRSQQI